MQFSLLIGFSTLHFFFLLPKVHDLLVSASQSWCWLAAWINFICTSSSCWSIWSSVGPLEFLMTFMMLALICLLTSSCPSMSWLNASTVASFSNGSLTFLIIHRRPVLLLFIRLAQRQTATFSGRYHMFRWRISPHLPQNNFWEKQYLPLSRRCLPFFVVIPLRRCLMSCWTCINTDLEIITGWSFST